MPILARTSRTRLVALSVGLAAALAMTGCSSDDSSTSKSTKKTTTTSKAAGKDSTTSTAKPDPKKFDEGVKSINKNLDDAKGDPCKVLDALQLSADTGNPSTPDQVKAAYGVIERALTAVANAAPDESATEAGIMRTAIKAMMDQAKKSEYSVEAFNSEEGSAAINTDDFKNAMQKVYAQVGQSCNTPAAGISTTTTG